MVIYDENGDKLENVDYSRGELEAVSKNVIHKYVVDAEEQGHYETIAEYPETGGKDVEWVVDSEETGHWETVEASNGIVVADFDGVISEDWPKDQEIESVWEYGVFKEYTPEQLEAIEEARNKAESEALAKAQLMTAASMFVQANVATMNDEQAASVSELTDVWKEDIAYSKDAICRYDNRLWRCAQGHTSQAGWEPPNAASLWYQIEFGDDGILVWRMPSGSHDAPNKGDKRHYPDASGAVYVSKRDGNTSVPGTDEWWEVDE